jgi:hypothetical protein
MLEFVTFGIIDNGIMILGAMCGLSLDKHLPSSLQKGLGAVIGAGLGNTLSDFLGGVGSLNMDLALGTALGCLIGLFFIPIIVTIGKIRKGR